MQITAIGTEQMLDITGVLPSTPIEALECILDLALLDLPVKGRAAKTAVRLFEAVQFKESR